MLVYIIYVCIYIYIIYTRNDNSCAKAACSNTSTRTRYNKICKYEYEAITHFNNLTVYIVYISRFKNVTKR